MGILLEELRTYFESTPKDILDKDWTEIAPLNEIGFDVIEYAEIMHSQLFEDKTKIVYICNSCEEDSYSERNHSLSLAA